MDELRGQPCSSGVVTNTILFCLPLQGTVPAKKKPFMGLRLTQIMPLEGTKENMVLVRGDLSALQFTEKNVLVAKPDRSAILAISGHV